VQPGGTAEFCTVKSQPQMPTVSGDPPGGVHRAPEGKRPRRFAFHLPCKNRRVRGGAREKKPLTTLVQLGLLTGFSFHHSSVHVRHMSIEIKIRKNEPIDRALRRMKKKLDRENIIKGTRAKRYYEKPCERRRRKEKVQAFTQMLRRRYAE
jgi:small subunit ribosomal protein S21